MSFKSSSGNPSSDFSNLDFGRPSLPPFPKEPRRGFLLNVIATQDWKGFDGFSPLNLEEKDEKTSKAFAYVTRRVGWKIQDMNGKLRKWDSRFHRLKAPFVDAYGDIANCGRIRGNVYNCSEGLPSQHSIWMREPMVPELRGNSSGETSRLNACADRSHQPGREFCLGPECFHGPPRPSANLFIEMEDSKPKQLIVMTSSGFRCSRRDSHTMMPV